LKAHPGGSDKLMMAAGGSIEPFWEMYSFHKRENIYSLLDKFKIGTLHEDDRMTPD
jgi:sulfite oxidase